MLGLAPLHSGASHIMPALGTLPLRHLGMSHLAHHELEGDDDARCPTQPGERCHHSIALLAEYHRGVSRGLCPASLQHLIHLRRREHLCEPGGMMARKTRQGKTGQLRAELWFSFGEGQGHNVVGGQECKGPWAWEGACMSVFGSNWSPKLAVLAATCRPRGCAVARAVGCVG